VISEGEKGKKGELKKVTEKGDVRRRKKRRKKEKKRRKKEKKRRKKEKKKESLESCLRFDAASLNT